MPATGSQPGSSTTGSPPGSTAIGSPPGSSSSSAAPRCPTAAPRNQFAAPRQSSGAQTAPEAGTRGFMSYLIAGANAGAGRNANDPPLAGNGSDV